MAKIMFKGNTVKTSGELPQKGTKAPSFSLTDGELGEKSLSDFKGKRKILNIVPSLDTVVCAESARAFDKEVSVLDNAVIITISRDLPFAQKRFRDAEGINHEVFLSQFRDDSFGKDYGVLMTEGPLAGLLSRAVVVLDENDSVIHTEQVSDIALEPDYTKAIAAVKGAAAG